MQNKKQVAPKGMRNGSFYSFQSEVFKFKAPAVPKIKDVAVSSSDWASGIDFVNLFGKKTVQGIQQFTASSASPNSGANAHTVASSVSPEIRMMEYKYKKGNCFQCHKCPQRFKEMRRIESHWKLVHNLRSSTRCDVCKLPFPSVAEMSVHKKTHGLACEECGKRFKKEIGLIDHNRAVHGKIIQQASKVSGVRYPGRIEALKHIHDQQKKMTGEVMIPKSELCNEKFLDSGRLDEHDLTHQSGFSCVLCEEEFEIGSALRVHYETLHPGFNTPTNSGA